MHAGDFVGEAEMKICKRDLNVQSRIIFKIVNRVQD
jgi:hypothetical protein